MAKTETQVNDLKLNFLTKEQFEAAKEAGEIITTELYFTPRELSVEIVQQMIDETINQEMASSQADLSVNDEANPAYVKNRTHWLEKSDLLLIDDANFDNSNEYDECSGYGSLFFASDNFSAFDKDKTYMFTFDGVYDGANVSLSVELNYLDYYQVPPLEFDSTVDGISIYIYIRQSSKNDGYYVRFGDEFVGKITLLEKAEIYHELSEKYIPNYTNLLLCPTYKESSFTDDIKYQLGYNKTPHILELAIEENSGTSSGGYIATKKFISVYKLYYYSEECAGEVEYYFALRSYFNEDNTDNLVWEMDLTEEQYNNIKSNWGIS